MHEWSKCKTFPWRQTISVTWKNELKKICKLKMWYVLCKDKCMFSAVLSCFQCITHIACVEWVLSSVIWSVDQYKCWQYKVRFNTIVHSQLVLEFNINTQWWKPIEQFEWRVYNSRICVFERLFNNLKYWNIFFHDTFC